MISAAMAASSAREMALVIPTPLTRVHVMGYVEARVVYTWSCVLPFFVFLKTAISVGPVPPILYFTDQVWAGALLGRFARALELGQGTCFILGALWGSMKVVVGYFPYFIKARSLFSAKCRGVGIVMNANWFPTLPQEFLWQDLLASFCCKHWGNLCLQYSIAAMICTFQVCLGGASVLFQKGKFACWSDERYGSR